MNDISNTVPDLGSTVRLIKLQDHTKSCYEGLVAEVTRPFHSRQGVKVLAGVLVQPEAGGLSGFNLVVGDEYIVV